MISRSALCYCYTLKHFLKGMLAFFTNDFNISDFHGFHINFTPRICSCTTCNKFICYLIIFLWWTAGCQSIIKKPSTYTLVKVVVSSQLDNSSCWNLTQYGFVQETKKYKSAHQQKVSRAFSTQKLTNNFSRWSWYLLQAKNHLVWATTSVFTKWSNSTSVSSAAVSEMCSIWEIL